MDLYYIKYENAKMKTERGKKKQTYHLLVNTGHHINLAFKDHVLQSLKMPSHNS